LNKKSAQKQKRPKETTASRKPLFHEKQRHKIQNYSGKIQIKTLQDPSLADGSLLLGQLSVKHYSNDKNELNPKYSSTG